MSGFWNEESDVDEFALPGDDARIAAITENNAAETTADTADNADTAPEEPATTEAATADERPRDEKGRFVPADDETPPDPEAAPAEAEPEPAPTPELILGKFKSNDDLAAAYRELEAFRGQQANEIGELRRQVEQVREQTAPQTTQYDAAAIQDHFAENPTAILPAIQQAYAAGDNTLVYLGIHALQDVDPVLAEGLRIEIAKRDAVSEMTEQVRPAMAQAETADFDGRARDLAARHPDIGDFIASQDIAALAEQFPLQKRAIVEGSPEDRFSAIESLYLIHRGRESDRVTDNLTDTTRQVARETAEQAAVLREEGFVASATQTAGAAELSPAEKIAAQWDEHDAPLKSGWNIA
ncbi:MAG: hypothetical protein NUW01_15590 [Gemmatimonadaceae bacterium]|nr:hypothetical protein [Gemmatimonadaceae bacterium]